MQEKNKINLKIITQVFKCLITHLLNWLFTRPIVVVNTRPTQRDIHLNNTEAAHNWLEEIDRSKSNTRQKIIDRGEVGTFENWSKKGGILLENYYQKHEVKKV